MAENRGERRAAVENRYDSWDHEQAMKAAVRKFISYDQFSAQLRNWREARLNIIEHATSVLSQVSNLGRTHFYSRTERFGGSSLVGDKLYVCLNETRMKTALNNIIVALQTVNGEGRARRLGPREASANTGGEDSALNVAHQLAEVDDLLTDESFLREAVFTQDKYELVNGLRWAGA
nr:coat protein [Potato mop-top virus]ALM54941.1 CP [Potato mop-top virus]ALM54965.1 CP [Potato mop-top virus]ALM54973.1 CP [Potato mop-top virus]ARS22105.1 coat protein [Potato mop-top virus]